MKPGIDFSRKCRACPLLFPLPCSLASASIKTYRSFDCGGDDHDALCPPVACGQHLPSLAPLQGQSKASVAKGEPICKQISEVGREAPPCESCNIFRREPGGGQEAHRSRRRGRRLREVQAQCDGHAPPCLRHSLCPRTCVLPIRARAQSSRAQSLGP